MSSDELGRRVWELRGPLMRLACAIVRRQQDAEDAVSEAVVRAFESLPALRCDAAVRPWLMKITARCCYDRLRRLRRETPCEDPEPLCAPVEPHGDGTLADLIAQLPAGQREAITLYYYEGFSAQEVAQALGVSRQLVSHWENGRVEPTQEQREAICKLLDIPMDAPKPTPLHKRILAAAALIAFVAILVMAVYPIYKSRRAGTTAEAAVQETQAPQGEKYSWEWFQQPDAQPQEGQAYVELTTAEKPLMLIESGDDAKPYLWNILIFAQETNGVPFTMEKITEVFFNNEKLPMYTGEMTGDEIAWYWYTTRLEQGDFVNYSTNRLADGGIGYGVAVEGKDDNGNELTFKLYIPLSGEIRPKLTPEDFTKEAEPQENQAYIRIEPTQDPVGLTQDAFFQGGQGWYYSFSMQNESDVAFTPESVMIVLFDQGEQRLQVVLPTSIFGFGEMNQGDEPLLYEDAAALQTTDCIGIMLRGTDANGNACAFTSMVHLTQGTNP